MLATLLLAGGFSLYWVLSTEAPLRDILPDLLVASASGATITAATQELYDAFFAGYVRSRSRMPSRIRAASSASCFSRCKASLLVTLLSTR